MRARIELSDDSSPNEVVIYCRQVTPEIEALVHTIERFEPGKQQLTYFKGDEQYYLSLREILFFETEADHVYAHTADQLYEVRMRLYELETTLPGYFVRASRSAIISIMHVFSVQKGLTGLSLLSFRRSHKEIYCSRMYGKELMRKLNERYIYENR